MNGLADRGQWATNSDNMVNATAKLRRPQTIPAPIVQLHDPECQRADANGDQSGRPRMRYWNIMAGNPGEFDPAYHQ